MGMKAFLEPLKNRLVVIIVLLLVIAWLNWQMRYLAFCLSLWPIYTAAERCVNNDSNGMSNLIRLRRGLPSVEFCLCMNLPTAIVIIDSKARVCWYNSVFRDWMPQDPDKTQRLNGFIPSLRLDKIWGKSGYFNEKIENKYYRVIYKFIDGTDYKGAPDSEVES